jgi:hypothetical protein
MTHPDEVPTIFVADDKGLLRVRGFARGFDFDVCHTAVNKAGKPAIALLRSNEIVAGIVCDNAWLQRAVGNICEAKLIRIEDALCPPTK